MEFSRNSLPLRLLSGQELGRKSAEMALRFLQRLLCPFRLRDVGDHGKAALTQALNVSQCRVRRSPGTILLLQGIGHTRLPRNIARYGFGEGGDVLCVRRMWEELANRGRIRKEIAKDVSCMRNGVEGNAVGNHARVSRQQQPVQMERIFIVRRNGSQLPKLSD